MQRRPQTGQWSVVRESPAVQLGLLGAGEPREIRDCLGLRGHMIEPQLELAQVATREESLQR